MLSLMAMANKNSAGRGASAFIGTGLIQRLKSDTHLAILSIFNSVASLAIGSFAVYRLTQGEIGVAFFDALLVAAMLGSLVYAWKTGRSVLAGNLVATLLAAGVLFLIFVLKLSYLWLLSLMIGIFLLASGSVSIPLSLLLIVAVSSVPEVFADHVERFTFLAVSVQIAVFSFVFSWQTRHQHRLLDDMANRDPLTGASNRRALRRDIKACVDAVRIGRECAALAMIDLDYFKRINDRHGHDAGDRVLVALAEIVGGTMRAGDSFYRYGGEEFVLVMPSTSPEGIAPALEKLQQAIRTRLRGPDGAVTVSIGAAGLKPAEDPSEWLSRADRALYAAKSGGRDRFCIDQD